MSIFEYDEELHNQTLYNEGLENGPAKGLAKGTAEGLVGLSPSFSTKPANIFCVFPVVYFHNLCYTLFV